MSMRERTSMFGWLYQSIIRSLLLLERAALEAIGDEKSLLSLLDGEQHDHEVPAAATAAETVTLLTRKQQQEGTTPSYRFCSRNRCVRYLMNILFLVVVVAIQVGYYICLTFLWGNSDSSSAKSLMRLEVLFTVPLLITFWFAAPIHTALGYFSKKETLAECKRNTDELLSDRKAHLFVALSLVSVLLSAIAATAMWISHSTHKLYGTISILVHYVTIYVHLLLTAVALRAIQVRLEEINNEVEAQLEVIHLRRDDYSSIIKANHRDLLNRWSEAYYQLGQDMGLLSQRFAARMIVAIALLLIVAANLMAMAWRRDEQQWSFFQTLLVVILYVSNSSMIMMALSSACFPVTMCTQMVGPNLVMLAVRVEAIVDVYTDEAASLIIRTCQVLANAFLLAPIEMYVGNFYIDPSVSNAVAGALIGLFLVVMGYNVPV